MKSKVNFKEHSFTLTFSIRTWAYILTLISCDLKKEHSEFFKTLFAFELSETKELSKFKPPFLFDRSSDVVLKFK